MNRRRLIASLALLVGTPGAAWAVERRWRIDPARSSLRLGLQALGRTRSGRFEDWSGDIVVDPARIETAEVALAIRAASLRMDDPELSAQAKSARFLNVADHPRIAVRLTSLTRAAADRYQATADVTLKGRTRAVRFPVTVRTAGDEARINGVVGLDRRAFGIGTGGVTSLALGREVRVTVAIVAVAA